MKTKIIGGVIFLIVLIVGFLGDGDFWIFINLPAIGFVAFATVGLTLMKYRKGIGKLEVINNLKKYSILSGVIGCLIGFVQMGWHVSDDLQMIPMGVAIAILTIIYGLIFYCILDAFTEHIRT